MFHLDKGSIFRLCRMCLTVACLCCFEIFLPCKACPLQVSDAKDVLIVVTRWYGGIHLGPDRFRCELSKCKPLMRKWRSAADRALLSSNSVPSGIPPQSICSHSAGTFPPLQKNCCNSRTTLAREDKMEVQARQKVSRGNDAIFGGGLHNSRQRVSVSFRGLLRQHLIRYADGSPSMCSDDKDSFFEVALTSHISTVCCAIASDGPCCCFLTALARPDLYIIIPSASATASAHS